MALTPFTSVHLSLTPSPLRVDTRVGRGGALVEKITFNRRVVGSTPA